jgi:hypothetical protein
MYRSRCILNQVQPETGLSLRNAQSVGVVGERCQEGQFGSTEHTERHEKKETGKTERQRDRTAGNPGGDVAIRSGPFFFCVFRVFRGPPFPHPLPTSLRTDRGFRSNGEEVRNRPYPFPPRYLSYPQFFRTHRSPTPCRLRRKARRAPQASRPTPQALPYSPPHHPLKPQVEQQGGDEEAGDETDPDRLRTQVPGDPQ